MNRCLKNLIIRDDDTSYFTKAEELDRAYKDIWHKGPISIAVIPFDVYTEGRGNIDVFRQDCSKEYPVGDNKELVTFIKQCMRDGKIYIMMHGYNHCYDMSKRVRYPFGIPEFVYKKNPKYYLQKGKEYLEKVFEQEIKWFVPPSNALSDEAVHACDALGLNIPLWVSGSLRQNVTLINIVNYIKKKLNVKFRKNFTLKYGNHNEVRSISFTKASDYENIIRSYPIDKFIIATHYWEVNECEFVKKNLEQYSGRAEIIHSMNHI